jgi:hypothetical protein
MYDYQYKAQREGISLHEIADRNGKAMKIKNSPEFLPSTMLGLRFQDYVGGLAGRILAFGLSPSVFATTVTALSRFEGLIVHSNSWEKCNAALSCDFGSRCGS